MNRRDFVLKAATGVSLAPLLSFATTNAKHSIDEIELFRYDINVPRHFSWGTWHNRQHVFMRMVSGEHEGWAEVAAAKNNPELNLADWGRFLHNFRGLTLKEAYKVIRQHQIGNGKQGKYVRRQLEFLLMGLLDLQGRIENRPAVALLNMPHTKPVPGLYTILDDDLDKVQTEISRCKAQGLDSHVKFKLFGDQALDLSIIELARTSLGKESFILSDANRGYQNWGSIDELADILRALRSKGLDAMEDPAELAVEQWIQLQDQIGDLALVPDYIMRPAWKGLERATPGMGRVFNFHPETMGSFHHLTLLAEKISGFGGKIMIGNASFVGPACNAWQQIAVGVGAAWVEAIEHPEESKDYLKCVVSKAMSRDEQGNFAMRSQPGFGLDIDPVSLREVCPKNMKI